MKIRMLIAEVLFLKFIKISNHLMHIIVYFQGLFMLFIDDYHKFIT